ncbi:MAG: phosphoribosylanthranilate isomerase [Flammeovirgaceae bacterium]
MFEKKLKIKVCGMREETNIAELSYLNPDLIGFIFYSKSPRFVSDKLLGNKAFNSIPSTKRVAVVVNESLENVLDIAKRYECQNIQLHGKETPEYCLHLKEKGFTILKAFGLNESFDFQELNKFEGKVDYFLFDTKGKQEGGNGVTFDWNLLDKYTLSTPFFLSGGIGLDVVNDIVQLSHNQCVGLDVNSKFETEPALKNIEKLKEFFRYFRT